MNCLKIGYTNFIDFKRDILKTLIDFYLLLIYNDRERGIRMTLEQIKHIIIHSFKDSLIAFLVILFIYIIFAFIEVKISNKISKENKLSLLFASLFGLVPQCGVSVVASDMYLKRHITMGTLVAIFLSCSDEAIPLLLASHSSKAFAVIPLLILKFVIGFSVGFVIDILIKDKKQIEDHLDHCHHEREVHVGCCHHHIDDEKENKLKKYLIHPLIHSLKIFIFVLTINLSFSFLIEGIGENNIVSFLNMNKYLAPLFTTIIGIIPSCSSSIIITEVYILGGINFGALFSGLLMNSGLGLIYLLKSKDNIKNTLKIVSICFLVSIIFGYLFTFIY